MQLDIAGGRDVLFFAKPRGTLPNSHPESHIRTHRNLQIMDFQMMIYQFPSRSFNTLGISSNSLKMSSSTLENLAEWHMDRQLNLILPFLEKL